MGASFQKTVEAKAVVRSYMGRGYRGDKLATVVMGQLAKRRNEGYVESWDGLKTPHPFWYEGYNRDKHGRAISAKRTRQLMIRACIGFLEEDLIAEASNLTTGAADARVGTAPNLSTYNSSSKTDLLVPRSSESVTNREPRTLEELMGHSEYRARTNDIVKNVIAKSAEFEWHNDHEDLEQEALAEMVKALPGFRGRSSIWTYMHTVAERAMLKYVSRHGRRQFLLASNETDQDALHAVALPAEGMDSELREALDMLKTIPNGQLLITRELGIADAELGRPDMIRKRRSRALKLLAAYSQ